MIKLWRVAQQEYRRHVFTRRFLFGLLSVPLIMVVMVGGVATEWGPAVGAIIMVLLAEMIRSLPVLGTAHHTFFGILLIVIIIFLPNGIVGDFAKLKRLVGVGRGRS